MATRPLRTRLGSSRGPLGPTTSYPDVRSDQTDDSLPLAKDTEGVKHGPGVRPGDQERSGRSQGRSQGDPGESSGTKGLQGDPGESRGFRAMQGNSPVPLDSSGFPWIPLRPLALEPFSPRALEPFSPGALELSSPGALEPFSP